VKETSNGADDIEGTVLVYEVKDEELGKG